MFSSYKIFLYVLGLSVARPRVCFAPHGRETVAFGLAAL